MFPGAHGHLAVLTSSNVTRGRKRTGTFDDLLTLASAMEVGSGPGTRCVSSISHQGYDQRSTRIAPLSPVYLGSIVVPQFSHVVSSRLQFIVPVGRLRGADGGPGRGPMRCPDQWFRQESVCRSPSVQSMQMNQSNPDPTSNAPAIRCYAENALSRSLFRRRPS